MKLLCVVPTYWPALQFGGPIVSVHTLNKELVRSGTPVTVFTTAAGQSPGLIRNQATDVDGVEVFYFDTASKSAGWFYSSELRAALDRVVSSFDLCYIVGIWSYPLIPAARTCLRNRIPYVVSPRGHLYPETFHKKLWKKWPYYKMIVQKLLKQANALHFTSQDECARSSLKFTTSNFVVANPVEVPALDGGEHERFIQQFPHLRNGKIILFLGRINWKKGLETLIDAYTQLQADEPVHLLIAGPAEHDYLQKIKDYAAQYGLSWYERGEQVKNNSRPAITYAGLLEGKDKWDALSASDVFVLPSFSENFGMSVAEAMSVGLPVVISNKVGLAKEIAKAQAGFIVSGGVEEYAFAIKNVLFNGEIRSGMSSGGKRLCSAYAPQEVVAGMLNHFQKLISSAHAGK